ncbi:hypothetical protein BOX15_Mlig009532g3 [Macrostomum lignano]|uniref:Uncharacterized protein n=1 Tax=Macrostomum lignano TaxID=282301 RepID=A0A267GBZ6_9PLAT|nr:hypothetical protein BOX15_Mlig009532g3 [Macrostomum lignano]
MSHISPIYNASFAIKQEIQRFESVHPSIYAIYDLIESIPDKDLQDKIHNYVVCIEDAFVNSQEWTLNRGIPELRLGVLGTPQSGKSALVHRYLTGSYMLDDSPEGGRFKKEVLVPDVGSCLLLIRDEGGPPDSQFAAWCDACVFVFALDCAESLDAVYQYYGRMAQGRSLNDLPLLLVGTQDTISESRPRVIDEVRSLKAAHDLRKCPYFETCATYGHNVDRVFQEACQRMAACSTARRCQTPTTAAAVAGGAGRPSPSHHHQQQQQQQHRALLGAYNLPPPGQGHASAGREYQHQVLLPASLAAHQYYEPAAHSLPVQQQASPQQLSSGKKTSDSTLWDHRPAAGDPGHNTSMASGQPAYYSSVAGSAAVITASASCNQPQQQPPLGMRGSRERASYAHGVSFVSSEQQQQQQPQQQPLQQQSSSGATPTQGRKSRRRSNLFSRKDEQQQQQQQQAMSAAMSAPTSTVGSGRAIPMKQGYLYKRSAGGALSRADWKKKYAALAETGQLTYYSSLHDYMADSHGKTIDLRLTTVKVPGQTRPTSNGLLLKTQLSQQQQQSAQSSQHPQRRRAKSSGRGGGGGIGDSAKTPDDDCSVGSSSASGTPAALGPPGSGFEFTIVSLDNRTWQFEAPSQAERDDWVRSIEQGILRQLQLLGRDGNPVKNGAGASSASNTSPLSSASGATAAAATASAAASVQLLRDILGNNVCADCGRPDPDWASINLGVLLCIECSGVHRNLGTHLSRVRSLNLDDWPANNVLVMRAIGNRLANSVWEACLDPASGVYKPNADSPRELKEQFIRAKYERREFLPELPYPDCPIQQQLVDAIARSDTRQVILCLAVAGPAVNRAYSQQDPRAAVHIAATLGQLPYLQLLLWYGADPAVRDAEGRTGHFYAAAAGKPDCAEFLLLAGCPPTNLMSTSMATATNNTASTAAATNSSVSSSSRRRSSRTASPTSPTNATMEIGL